MVYFGKPHQCYRCHILAVYKSWGQLYKNRKNVIEAVCRRFDIDEERFKAASLLTVAFHDGGKPAQNFQSAMASVREKDKNKNGKTENDHCRTCKSRAFLTMPNKNEPSYRHEIIGGLLAIHFGRSIDQFLGKTILNGFPFEFSSIIGHHKPVNPNSFRREWNDFFGELDELETIGFGKNELNHVVEVAKELFESEGMQLPILGWNTLFDNKKPIIEAVKEQIDTLPFTVQTEVENAGSTRIFGTIREIHALLKSLLIAADWEGSSDQEIHKPLDISVDKFWERVKEKVERGSGKKFKIKNFQEQLSSAVGHRIAIAPTGSGKTEAAIAWALNQRSGQSGYAGKLLYLLPTQVLTNSIYERLLTYLDPENSGRVGLLHSGALLYQVHSRMTDDESDQYDPKIIKDEKDLHRLNKMMFRPIMVATVDQLLSTAFNGNKRWAVVMGELMGGTIIFDEVHAYDGHMLALLERVTRELRDSTRILFMSATMPKALHEFFSYLLGYDVQKSDHVIKDQELLDSRRNKFYDRTRETLLDKKGKMKASIIAEIKSHLEHKKRVAVVCNTVKTAQILHAELSEKRKDILVGEQERMCFHSRFIAKDRRNRETRLERDKGKSRSEQSWPQLLIATQVIECGLDIDYDVMYTEGAPLEALIQRAGRVNRERSVTLGEVHVFKQDDSSQRFYPPEITERGLDILKKEIQENPLISEEQFIEIIEQIYENKRFENDPRFLNARRVLDELMYDIGGIHDLPETDLHTRFVTYKMVEVIPEELWDEIKDQHQFKIMDYLIKMPLWAYLYNKVENSEDWKIMNMEYDTEIGGKLKKDTDTVLFA